jgi:hypothetical protein
LFDETLVFVSLFFRYLLPCREDLSDPRFQLAPAAFHAFPSHVLDDPIEMRTPLRRIREAYGARSVRFLQTRQ